MFSNILVRFYEQWLGGKAIEVGALIEAHWQALVQVAVSAVPEAQRVLEMIGP